MSLKEALQWLLIGMAALSREYLQLGYRSDYADEGTSRLPGKYQLSPRMGVDQIFLQD
jgi:hypothetical protein